jgi:hypothetical protein
MTQRTSLEKCWSTVTYRGKESGTLENACARRVYCRT